jgi:hypothetical protein
MTGVDGCVVISERGVVLAHETASKHALNGMALAFFINPALCDIVNLPL